MVYYSYELRWSSSDNTLKEPDASGSFSFVFFTGFPVPADRRGWYRGMQHLPQSLRCQLQPSPPCRRASVSQPELRRSGTSSLVLFEPFLISVFIYIHFFLTTSIPLQNRQNRLKQNLNIQSDIPLGNIFCIQADDFFKVCDVASAADLPHSGDSGLDGDSGTVVQLILFQFVGEDGAGSC